MLFIGFGEVFMFGSNEYGQLGTGTLDDKRFPARVLVSQHKSQKISCGRSHTLILNAQGNIYSFGLNMSGQLGIANKQNSCIPVKVLFPEEAKISYISASNHSAVITSRGELYVWGEQSPENHILPHKVSSNIDIEMTAIETGHGFTITLDRKGHAWGSGVNNVGQLGQDDLEEEFSIVQVPGTGAANVKAFSCGKDFVIALADFSQEVKNSKETRVSKETVETLKDSVKMSSNRQGLDERFNKQGHNYESSDEVNHEDFREDSKVLESDLESLSGNFSHAMMKHNQVGRESKAKIAMDLAAQYTTPGLFAEKYPLNIKDSLKGFETYYVLQL